MAGISLDWLGSNYSILRQLDFRTSRKTSFETKEKLRRDLDSLLIKLKKAERNRQMTSRYRTKDDPKTSTKPYRPQVGLWVDPVKEKASIEITPTVAAELKRIAEECLNGTLYFGKNKFKREEKHPTHQLTSFTAEERAESIKKYATEEDLSV